MSKKNLKKLLVATMAMVMLFGNSLSVLAAVNYSFMNLPEAPEKQQVQDGDEIFGNNFDVYIDGVLVAESATNKPITGDYYASRSGDKLHLTSITPTVIPGDGGETQKTNKTEPSQIVEVQKSNKTEHRHNFQWKIVKDPTLREDGLAQSVCECGVVEAQQPISAGTAFINMVRDKIEAAPEGGTVEISSELYFCYTAKIMKALQARPDVSLKTNYLTEDGTWHTFTIPAGSAPAGDTQFYGFTGLANYYNGGSGDCDHVHDEVCGGEENCEHVHDEDCDIEEDCEHIHDEACGYVEGTDADCAHVHNEDC